MIGFITAIIRGKLYALILGPAGFGIISQINSFVTLISQTVHLGVPVGITSEISKLNSENYELSQKKIKTYFLLFNIVFGMISTVISVMIFIFSGHITLLLVDDSGYSYILSIFVLSLPFMVIYFIVESFLKSFELIDILVKISVISNIISVIFLVILIYFIEFLGVAFYLFIFGVTPLLIFLLLYRNKLKFRRIKIKTFIYDKTDIKNILKIGLVSLVSSILHQGAIILLRKFTISHFGLVDNGIYQSVLSISISYFSIIYIFLSSYSLPHLSKIKDDKCLIKDINSNFRFILILILPMVIVSFTYKDLIIQLLYSKSFSTASSLFLPQLIGDVFRAFAALISLWMISRMKIKQMMLIDLIFNSTLILIPYLLFEYFNNSLIIVPASYLIAFSLHFILYFGYTVYSLKFRFEKLILKNIFISIFTIALCFSVCIINNNAGYLFSVIMLFIWILLILNKEEKKKLLNYSKSLMLRKNMRN